MQSSNNLTSNQLAEYLLQIKAIKLNLQTPYTWASGIKSPIYCDNRLTLSYPVIRNFIKENFAAYIKANVQGPITIAGVATAGIPHGAILADALQVPFVYVRSSPKAHGLTNLIEGKLDTDTQVIVIEDLISTGKSSLEVVSALRSAGANIWGMLAIFTYGFEKASNAFAEANCTLHTLCNYEILIQAALKNNYVSAEDMNTLQQWRIQPETWKQ